MAITEITVKLECVYDIGYYIARLRAYNLSQGRDYRIDINPGTGIWVTFVFVRDVTEQLGVLAYNRSGELLENSC